jgi:hypothetical protein
MYGICGFPGKAWYSNVLRWTFEVYSLQGVVQPPHIGLVVYQLDRISGIDYEAVVIHPVDSPITSLSPYDNRWSGNVGSSVEA